MSRWAGKVAAVTGASSGIGLHISKDLLESGVKVIGLARRLDRLDEFQKSLPQSLQGNFYYTECDVSDLESIKRAFTWISEKFQHINILINNAGIIRTTKILSDDNETALNDIISVNVMGLIYCAKEAVKLMKKTDEEGYIINLSSVAAHSIPPDVGAMAFGTYFPSKYAVRATSEILRQELQEFKTIRIGSISPGTVKTEIFSKHPAGGMLATLERNLFLDPADISRSVLFILEQPEHVAIDDIIIKPRIS